MRMVLTKSVLTLSLILILFPLIGHSAERDLVDADGNGLIEIYDLSDLNEIRNNLDGKALYGSSQGCPDDGCVGFELKADLDFDTNGDGIIDEQDAYWNNGAGWLPIGNSSQRFTAEFNGNGHVIRNLYINRPTTSYIGLFGYTDGALISRVGLAGTLTQIIGNRYVGGLVGYASGTKLQGVFSTGSVSSSYSGSIYIGGIAGYLSSGSLIEDSFSSASVDANGNFVGGLVGYFSGSEAKRAFSVGFVRGDSSSYVGGLTGLIFSSPISYSYWATDASGQNGSGGSSTSTDSSYFGATLAQLRCATSANDTNCVENRTLFENWPTDAAANNGIAWVFGDGTQLPALRLNGKEYRDSDGDGFLDEDDAFPNHYAAAIDMDEDGHPDRWTLGCDTACQQSSGFTLDAFPNHAAASIDTDGDGYPDAWNAGCDIACQQSSGLTLDAHPNDYYNGAGVPNHAVDKDQNGLIDIETLEQLNAIRYNLAGTGLVLEQGGEINSEGCPARIVNGTMQRLCRGYELKADLDFDTNGDGVIDAQDAYWNEGAGWLPLGGSSTNQAFQAEFNGNGHVIRNLYINRPTTSYIGLFGYTDGALISRVGLAGTLTQIIGNKDVGGLVGYASGTKLQGVFSTGSVSSSYSGFIYIGGIAGDLSSGSLIEDSFSSASVDANGNFVGGLVGYFSDSEVKRVFSVGFVRGDSSSYVGGLTGLIFSSPISYSYWATDASGQSSSYGSSTSANSNYFGAALAQLRCATDVSNASCVENRTLFENWPTDAAANNGIAWVFGDGTQLPALRLNGKEYRDSDGDGFLDEDDVWPDNYAAAIDMGEDGYPDRWTLGCDTACQQSSDLQLDMFPETEAAWQDDDVDGLPDNWAEDCDETCQQESGLTLDAYPNDYYNGAGVPNHAVDKDQNGLIDIETLEQLNAIRYNLAGTGLVLEQGGEINSEGCPARIVNGTMQRLCRGYELKADLDFDTNGDGVIDAQDAYWNEGAGWLPLGSSSTNQAFQAEFNGNGHVIRNLYINRPTTSYIGLFGYTDGALISRVGLAGTLTQIIGNRYVGGLVGRGSATKLQGVFSTGSVSSDSSSSAYVGGIVGYLSSGSLIEDSFSSASVDANGNFVGGLVGYFSDSEAKRVFSVGFVRGDSSSYVGGLTGLIFSSPINYSYWATDASGQNDSYGSSTSASSNYFGAALAQLRCATSANDTNCVENRTLFENWPTDAAANNGIAWVFGDGTQLPALRLNGKEYRDSDGDGFLDEDDVWPDNYAAAIDMDEDGHPDRWTLGCDTACQQSSGFTLDAFPNHAAASIDTDGDGYPDAWNADCDTACQQSSGLTLDEFPNHVETDVVEGGEGRPDG